MPELIIGMSAWIIQDGNYSDFEVGDIAEFAIEFYGVPSSNSTISSKSMHRIVDNIYDVQAKVIYINAKVWVIDFGFYAFCECPPHDIALGSWVIGQVSLGIDPFFYSEYLRKLEGMPNLFYRWQVQSIKIDDTPRVFDNEQSLWKRQTTQANWIALTKTDAWTDDDGSAEYLLSIESLDTTKEVMEGS